MPSSFLQHASACTANPRHNSSRIKGGFRSLWGMAAGWGMAWLLGLGATTQLPAATIVVSTSGTAGAAGTTEAPLGSLGEAAERAQPGDVIELLGGVYAIAATIQLRSSGTEAAPIRIQPAAGGRPLLDFSDAAPGSRGLGSGIAVSGNYWQIRGLEVIHAPGHGIMVSGSFNHIDRCVCRENGGSGVHLGSPASHNLVLNCDAYRNVDRPTQGQNADGFAAKFEIGPGNIFRGCRAWENADDGFDLWRAPHPVRLEYCVAFRNGVDLWQIEGFTGNGNGFKLGGDFIAAAHVVIGCVATDQPRRGFDLNNNSGGVRVESCTATRCGTGFAMNLTPRAGGQHNLRQCLSFGGDVRLAEGTVSESCLWLDADGAEIAPLVLAAPGIPYVSRRRPNAVPADYQVGLNREALP